MSVVCSSLQKHMSLVEFRNGNLTAIFLSERGSWRSGEASGCLSHQLWRGWSSGSLFLPEKQLLKPNSASKEAPQAAEPVPSEAGSYISRDWFCMKTHCRPDKQQQDVSRDWTWPQVSPFNFSHSIKWQMGWEGNALPLHFQMPHGRKIQVYGWTVLLPQQKSRKKTQSVQAWLRCREWNHRMVWVQKEL